MLAQAHDVRLVLVGKEKLSDAAVVGEVRRRLDEVPLARPGWVAGHMRLYDARLSQGARW